MKLIFPKEKLDRRDYNQYRYAFTKYVRKNLRKRLELAEKARNGETSSSSIECLMLDNNPALLTEDKISVPQQSRVNLPENASPSVAAAFQKYHAKLKKLGWKVVSNPEELKKHFGSFVYSQVKKVIELNPALTEEPKIATRKIVVSGDFEDVLRAHIPTVEGMSVDERKKVFEGSDSDEESAAVREIIKRNKWLLVSPKKTGKSVSKSPIEAVSQFEAVKAVSSRPYHDECYAYSSAQGKKLSDFKFGDVKEFVSTYFDHIIKGEGLSKKGKLGHTFAVLFELSRLPYRYVGSSLTGSQLIGNISDDFSIVRVNTIAAVVKTGLKLDHHYYVRFGANSICTTRMIPQAIADTSVTVLDCEVEDDTTYSPISARVPRKFDFEFTENELVVEVNNQARWAITTGNERDLVEFLRSKEHKPSEASYYPKQLKIENEWFQMEIVTVDDVRMVSATKKGADEGDSEHLVFEDGTLRYGAISNGHIPCEEVFSRVRFFELAHMSSSVTEKLYHPVARGLSGSVKCETLHGIYFDDVAKHFKLASKVKASE